MLVLTINSDYLPLALSFLCRLHTLGITSFLLLAEDRHTYRTLHPLGGERACDVMSCHVSHDVLVACTCHCAAALNMHMCCRRVERTHVTVRCSMVELMR